MIDTVIISHFHGDHVNGLLTTDNQPAFPNAEVLVPATEWKFWSDDGEMSRASAGRMADLFKNNRRIFDAGRKKKVTPYDWNKEVAPGITAVGTIGHSPATRLMCSRLVRTKSISSPTSPIIPICSCAIRAGTPLRPRPKQAETTRRKVYDMVVAEKLMVQGFHYPFPGLGHVEKDGTGLSGGAGDVEPDALNGVPYLDCRFGHGAAAWRPHA